jgi:hypothetical protein
MRHLEDIDVNLSILEQLGPHSESSLPLAASTDVVKLLAGRAQLRTLHMHLGEPQIRRLYGYNLVFIVFGRIGTAAVRE